MRLPPEIWEQIFLNVLQQNQWSFNSDLLNCSRTCRQFEAILEAIKTTWLFKYILPHIFSALDKPTLLTLRRVCKTWNWAVNNFLINFESCWEATQFRHPLPHHRAVKEDFHPLGAHQWLTKFSGNWKLKQFLKEKHSHKHHFSPFPGGSVEISFQSSIWNIDTEHITPEVFENADRMQAEFWNLFLELLLRVGVHIIFLKIRIRNHGPESMVLDSLIECLNHVPNLKRLNLDIHFPEKPSLSTKDDIVISLPSLPQLTCLEFAHTYLNNFGFPLPDYFQSQFAAPYLPQLKRLQLSLNEGIWSRDYFKIGRKIEAFHLTDLELKVAYPGHLEIFNFFQLPDSKPKFKKINLHLWFPFTRRIEVSVSDILKFIVPFADSLEILNMFFVGTYLNLRSNISRVRLLDKLTLLSVFCKLKILHMHGIHFDRFWESYPYRPTEVFFDKMPKSLEYFYIECFYWYGLPRGLQHFSIDKTDEVWTNCPNLKGIRIADQIRYEWDDGEKFVENGDNASIYWRKEWEWRTKCYENTKEKLNQLSKLQGRNCCGLI